MGKTKKYTLLKAIYYYQSSNGSMVTHALRHMMYGFYIYIYVHIKLFVTFFFSWNRTISSKFLTT